jgi:glycine/D-amino acid oxidase-like deaminating enzyme
MRLPRKVSPSHSPTSPLEELLALPAVLVPDLPLPVTLWLAIEGAPARVQLTTRERAGPTLASQTLADVIAFDREELRAIVLAVQADRLWRKDLLGLCFDKWRRPDHRLTLSEALAGANTDETQWTLGRVLSRIGATIDSFELGDESSLDRLSVAA